MCDPYQNSSGGISDFPARNEKILRKYRLILPKYRLIPPKKFSSPPWQIFFSPVGYLEIPPEESEVRG